ncbi:MAG: hypothetical protein AAF602_02035 [Myxococcota bacterium]
MVPLALSLIDHLPIVLEDRLQQELALLDVAVTPVAVPAFRDATLEDRLATLREREVTSPAAWLSVTDDTVQVSIATIAGARASVRVVEVAPGPDAPAELALGVREILGQLVPPVEAPPRRPDLRPRVSAGIVIPTRRLSAGPRALVQADALLHRGRLAGGGLAALQVGDGQWRVGLGAVGRLGPALALAQVDLVNLP